LLPSRTIGVHNETLSVVAVCVRNPDRSPVGINASDAAPTLRSRGAVVPDGWHLIAASLISADGNTIYGWGFNPDNLIEMYKVVLN
jgi:hypothetical protein